MSVRLSTHNSSTVRYLRGTAVPGYFVVYVYEYLVPSPARRHLGCCAAALLMVAPSWCWRCC